MFSKNDNTLEKLGELTLYSKPKKPIAVRNEDLAWTPDEPKRRRTDAHVDAVHKLALYQRANVSKPKMLNRVTFDNVAHDIEKDSIEHFKARMLQRKEAVQNGRIA